jgi:hypothetical protein
MDVLGANRLRRVRFFAWIQWQRRILIRWEYHAHNLGVGRKIRPD